MLLSVWDVDSGPLFGEETWHICHGISREQSLSELFRAEPVCCSLQLLIFCCLCHSRNDIVLQSFFSVRCSFNMSSIFCCDLYILDPSVVNNLELVFSHLNLIWSCLLLSKWKPLSAVADEWPHPLPSLLGPHLNEPAAPPSLWGQAALQTEALPDHPTAVWLRHFPGYW